MPEEIIPIVNEQDEVIDIRRISQVHQEGLLHREAYVYLINLKKEVLLQKRKDNGLFDHSAAGHFPITESYVQGAKREFEEELGTNISIDELQELCYQRMDSIKPHYRNQRFVKVYLLSKDIALEQFNTDPLEVAQVKYFTKPQVQVLLQHPSLITASAKLLIEKYILQRL